MLIDKFFLSQNQGICLLETLVAVAFSMLFITAIIKTNVLGLKNVSNTTIEVKKCFFQKYYTDSDINLKNCQTISLSSSAFLIQCSKKDPILKESKIPYVFVID